MTKKKFITKIYNREKWKRQKAIILVRIKEEICFYNDCNRVNFTFTFLHKTSERIFTLFYVHADAPAAEAAVALII